MSQTDQTTPYIPQWPERRDWVDDAEAARRIRYWLAAPPVSPFGWPTDSCGYEQHIRFVNHRNANWTGSTVEEWRAFVAAYADALGGPTDAE